MRGYTLAKRTCPACRQLGALVWAAFETGFVDDRAAALRAIVAVEDAERELAADHELLGCAIPPQPKRRPARRVPGFELGAPLVAATDASYLAECSGMGYVVSDGRWGMQHRGASSTRYLPDPTGPSRVLIAELRAVLLLLSDVGDDAADMLLLVDSTTAIGYLRSWRSGHVRRMPAGYNLRPRFHGGPPAMVELAQMVHALGRGLRVEHVKGHSAHSLNEAADSLSKLGRRRPADAKARAESVVQAFLKDWHNQPLSA